MEHINPLNNITMRKYIARNRKTGETVFCKYEICNSGILRVEYYLPKTGFSVIWNRMHPMTALSSVRKSADGRKSIVTYFIHPMYYIGYDLNHMTFSSHFDGICDCLTDNIKLL